MTTNTKSRKVRGYVTAKQRLDALQWKLNGKCAKFDDATHELKVAIDLLVVDIGIRYRSLTGGQIAEAARVYEAEKADGL